MLGKSCSSTRETPSGSVEKSSAFLMRANAGAVVGQAAGVAVADEAESLLPPSGEQAAVMTDTAAAMETSG
jgi:hypothetical protein